PRTTRVSGCAAAYVGYCERCEMPAVHDGAQLVCPTCRDVATPVPPPDDLVVRWYPIDQWVYPMAMHRAILRPDWSATEAWNDALETVDAHYQAMLTRLGLTHRESRPTHDFDGWRRDLAHERLLHFYAMIDCVEGFQSIYQALVDDQKDLPNTIIPELDLPDLPAPATTYPFKPGEAVFYLQEQRAFSAEPPTLIPAIVLEPSKPGKRGRVTIWCKDEKRASVSGHNLIYQGYCAFCGVPAVLNREALVCPRCSEPATAVPPPPELTLRWYPLGSDYHAQAVRACALNKCGWSDGLDIWRERDRRAWSMFEKHRMLYDKQHGNGPWALRDEDGYGYFECRMRWYAELGDEESFLAYYTAHGGELPIERLDRLVALFNALERDDVPGPSRRLDLPPLDIERIADDSEPDGADDLTTWLDRQFKRAA
ncbi:MAG: hypothetical protein M3R61_20330, partial [Chloroflexota bacterium]|nr:hypothetical protein [Chloroflexota bacterium]